MHTAGIYADMSVDGPEIGTLVMVIDRAKNLPNRKTMGKQNPYCAARLGKEAKKTKTDPRGGQTPRWDEEIRFVVHDSPDYQNIKISIFNDDKKTDLISEAWISLSDVLKPGGGQGDQWHHLTYKGKYAGEIRMELTYYDSRPRPDGRRDSSARGRQGSHGTSLLGTRQSSVVKRRPLPGDPASGAPSPRMGPREYSGELHSPSTTESYRPLPQINSQVHADENLPEAMPQYSPYDPGNRFLDDMDQGNDDYHVPMSDDPYALQALEDNHNNWDDDRDNIDSDAPRNDRVDALSNYSIARSNPPHLQHTYSAPDIGPYETVAQAEHGYPHDQQYNNYDSPPLPPARHNYSYADSPNARHSYDNSPRSPRDVPANHYQQFSPLPSTPGHRNSAPNLPRMAPVPASMQYSGTPTRALHMPTSVADLPHGTRKVTPQRHSYSDPHSLQQEYNNSPSYGQNPQRYSPHTPPYPDAHHIDQQRRGSNYQQSPSFGRTQAAPSDPRRNPGDQYQPTNSLRGRPLPLQARPQQSPQASFQGQPPHLSTPQYRSQPQSPNPQQSPYGSPRAPYGQSPGPPLHNPHSQSPGMNTPSSTPYRSPYIQQPVPRKSMSPMPSPHQPSTPHSQHLPNPYTTPSHQPPAAFRDPVPMYASSPIAQSTTPISSIMTIEPDMNPLEPHTSTATSAPPIIGADGRVKDPSDHLPESSYAPEPLRKAGQSRPSINVTMKNRFGPRELEVNKGPLGARSGNAVGAGPPPVPGKVPLGGLERDMARLDIGAKSPSSGGGGVFGRFRKAG